MHSIDDSEDVEMHSCVTLVEQEDRQRQATATFTTAGTKRFTGLDAVVMVATSKESFLHTFTNIPQNPVNESARFVTAPLFLLQNSLFEGKSVFWNCVFFLTRWPTLLVSLFLRVFLEVPLP